MKAYWIAAVLVCIAVNPVPAQAQTNSIEWSFTGELNLAPSVLDEQPRIYDKVIENPKIAGGKE